MTPDTKYHKQFINACKQFYGTIELDVIALKPYGLAFLDVCQCKFGENEQTQDLLDENKREYEQQCTYVYGMSETSAAHPNQLQDGGPDWVWPLLYGKVTV